MKRTFLGSSRWMAAAGSAAVTFAALADTGLQNAPAAKPQAGSAAATASWVTAKSKHNGSGVRLRYSVPGQLQPGRLAAVRLQFSGVTAEGATADVRAPDGATLTTASGQSIGRIALPVGQITTLDLRVLPSGDGLQTLDVFTSQAQRSSAQSVPLKVGHGEAKLKSMGKAQTTPAGEKVISLPAQSRTK